MFPFALVLALLVLTGAVPASARERWRPPLPGGVVAARFTFDRAAPYAGGVRRGVDLRAAPGAAVVAACGGTVTHAGRVPRWARGVSLRCGGGLVATELGLATTAVAPGARVLAGAAIGRLGPRGVLRLGARRATSRHGYVDPLALLDDTTPPPIAPLAPGRRRSPRGGALPPVAPPAPAPRPSRHTAPRLVRRPSVSAPHHATVPWPAYAGCALLLTGAGAGRVAVRRRHRPRRAGIALAQR